MSRRQHILDNYYDGGTHYLPEESFEPREWQIELCSTYQQSIAEFAGSAGPHCFCVYAGTGSGKTKAAAFLASYLLSRGLISQVVVVSPNISIIGKTRADFLKCFGIDLVQFNKEKHGCGVPRKKQGYILTYGKLMQSPEIHKDLCEDERTLVIFDEIHHLGGDINNQKASEWAKSAESAFGRVAFIIALTGTPYRSDNTLIPFVRYEDGGDGLRKFNSSPPYGYTYSLGRAVADGVCREPFFAWCDGKVEIRYGLETGIKTLSFEDAKVTDQESSDRLRGAVQYGSPARRQMLLEAIRVCREEQRKMIIFLGGDTASPDTAAYDANKFLPNELECLGVSLDDYECVTSEKRDAQKKIEAFGRSSKWIMGSIQMVSEGTDIPELSVAVFLTTVTAKQTTAQRIGRVLRAPELYPDAKIFMFKDPALYAFASELKGEIQQEIALKKARDRREQKEGQGEKPSRREVRCVEGGRVTHYTFNGKEWPADYFIKTRNLLREKNLPHTMLDAALHLFIGNNNGNGNDRR